MHAWAADFMQKVELIAIRHPSGFERHHITFEAEHRCLVPEVLKLFIPVCLPGECVAPVGRGAQNDRYKADDAHDRNRLLCGR